MAPIDTNTNVAPFYDDFNPQNFYYKMLFQPGVSVQTRELNQLQSMLQNQIEKFGDNILVSGTIVSGCNFTFLNPYPYIKIADLDTSGNVNIPFKFVNYQALNETTGMLAQIVDYVDGFETTAPDLKTLYLRYTNFGSNGGTTSFTAGDTIKVLDQSTFSIEQIAINNGGQAFSNGDQLVATPQLIVSVNSGTLTPGDYLTNGLGGNLQIVSVDSTTYATISAGQTVANPAATLSANVGMVLGFNFKGQVLTDSTGVIINTIVINKGAQYSKKPWMTVRSVNNSTGYVALDLDPHNYVAQIKVSATSNSVGNGYSFQITEGVIYQKGYFLQVVPQNIKVAKYNTLPDNVSVCFTTTETIVDSNIDQSLLDNVGNTQNQQAPGAMRLQLVPKLTLVNASSITANGNIFPIVSWKAGQPYKQNQTSDYSVIGNEMAQRTKDAEGDFVVDPFLVTTRSPVNSNNEGNTYNVVIDPGVAYISGYAVKTQDNFNIDVPKCTDSNTVNLHSISLNYGNYFIINNVGGIFQYNTGDTVDLYDTAKQFYANAAAVSAANTTPAGTKIGTANIRSLIHQDNIPGTAIANYRLYVFNIQMLAGKNIRDVRATYYNGTNKGIADIVTQYDTTSNTNICQIQNPQNDRLLFYSGVDSLKNANTVVYNYRTIDQTVTFANTATSTLVYNIAGLAPEILTTSDGSLSSSAMQDLYLVPTASDLVAQTGTTGTVVVTSGQSNVVGTATTFLADYAVGDYVYVANNTGGTSLQQINSIANNLFLTLNGTLGFSNATGTTLKRVFPQYVPIPLGYRTGLTVTGSGSQTILTFNLGVIFSFSGTKAAALGVNIQRVNPTQLTKTANRNVFVAANTANAVTTGAFAPSGGVLGPWCLGVPDVFRLRGVYIGNSTVSNTGTNYISNFFVDHNQDSDWLGLSWLILKPTSNLIIPSANTMLIQFDYFTSSGAGFYDTVSYVGSSAATIQNNNSQPLSALTSAINQFEIPELFDNGGNEYDLMQYFDFRPYAANTVAPSTLFSTPPLDPTPNLTLSVAGEKKFPVPDSTFLCNMEYYLRRTDSVFVDKNTNFTVLQGRSSANSVYLPPTQPTDTLKLTDLIIPTYPQLAINYNNNMDQILTTNIANQKYITRRNFIKTIAGPTSNNVLPYNQPKVYTMYDIGNLDRRLSAVEYYTSLNTLQTGLANKNIPSSVTPALNRFKFGIFVDDFTTSNNSAISDPQYAAQKEGIDIVPPKMSWDVSLIGGGNPPYIDFPIINQGSATVGSISDPLSLGPICALNLANTVAYTQIFRNATDAAFGQGSIDSIQVTMAQNATVSATVDYVQQTLTQYLAANPEKAALFQNQPQDNALVTDRFNFIIGTTSEVVQIPSGGFSGSPTDGPAAAPAFTTEVFSVNSGTFNTLVNTLAQPFIARYGQSAWNQFLAQYIARFGSTGAIGQTGSLDFTFNVTTNGQPAGSTSLPASGTFAATKFNPPVVLYFYNYDQNVKIEIFQGNSLVVDTSTAVALTAEDINLLVGAGGQQFFNDQTNLFLKNPVIAGSFASFAGKIQFNYDPSLGNIFTVKTTESAAAFQWRWVMGYPIDGSSVGCTPINPHYTVTPNFIANYQLQAASAWCSNGQTTLKAGVIYTGYTETWNPTNTITPTTSTIPFDISADWLK